MSWGISHYYSYIDYYVMLMEESQDNILTTVDNITLQSDMIYTCILVIWMENVILLVYSTNFSK